jgi:flagellar basal body L-ring protein FlgH
MPLSWSFQATPVLLFSSAVALAGCSCSKVEEPAPSPPTVATGGQKSPLKEQPTAVTATGKLTTAECHKLFEHFLDVSVNDMLKKNTNEGMSEEEKAKAAEPLRNVLKSATDFSKKSAECQQEYSRQEYECMLKATTERGFDACISGGKSFIGGRKSP